ncbi:THO complex subunit 4, partial [Phenoliferia sp. Uapishka_3]
MNLDKPLDEIISAKKGAGRGGRRNNNAGGGRPARAAGGEGGQARRAPVERAQPQQQQQPTFSGDKIVVSNLPEDVTEAQIKELFTSTVGPLRSASLAYDSKGKSKGVATIQFQKAADANKAYEQYNKRLVDGKRPMKVEIIIDPSRAPALPLGARLGVAPTGPKPVSATVAAAGGNARQPRAAGTGGRRGGRGGGAGRQPERPKATLESLDAEMSDYIAGGAKTDA